MYFSGFFWKKHVGPIEKKIIHMFYKSRKWSLKLIIIYKKNKNGAFGGFFYG
jgi:hypothetical protein